MPFFCQFQFPDFWGLLFFNLQALQSLSRKARKEFALFFIIVAYCVGGTFVCKHVTKSVPQHQSTSSWWGRAEAAGECGAIAAGWAVVKPAVAGLSLQNYITLMKLAVPGLARHHKAHKLPLLTTQTIFSFPPLCISIFLPFLPLCLPPILPLFLPPSLPFNF